MERERRQTGNIIHVLVDYNVHAALGVLVCRYVGDGEGFRHLGSLLLPILALNGLEIAARFVVDFGDGSGIEVGNSDLRR